MPSKSDARIARRSAHESASWSTCSLCGLFYLRALGRLSWLRVLQLLPELLRLRLGRLLSALVAPSLLWRVAEALVGRRTRQAWPRMARASLTRSLGQDAFLFWNCASLGSSLFWNLAFSLILKRPRSHFCVSSGIRVCKAGRPPVTTETGRSQIRQWHGQDTGLGLRNIAIIWGESAT